MEFDKTVLQKGSGLYCPNKLSKVVVDISGKWSTTDGKEAVFDHRENASIELGVLYLEAVITLLHIGLHHYPDQANDELEEAVEDMICTMKENEKAEFRLHRGSQLLSCSLHQLDDHQRPPSEEAIQTTITIHLHSFRRGRDTWDLTDQDRLEIARRHKEEGSKLFKSNHVSQAAMRYSKSLQYLAAVDPDTPLEVENLEDYEREIISLRIVSLLNLAACQLRLNQYAYVVRNCSRVLEVEGGTVKGWYRRAKALLAMRDYESARSDLMKAGELDPGNQAVSDLLKAVDVQESAHRAKYKDALKTMFN